MNLLGIDLGTTKTLAARWDERTQTARTIRLGRGSDAIPTTLYCDHKGEFQYGEDADDMRVLDAAGWKGRIKRDLGKGASIVLHGRSYKVVHLISRFLGYVRQRVEEEVFHGKIDHTVITVPALYGPSERSELKDAAALAGLRSVELVDEPVAAGRAFLHEKTGTELGDQVLVFDWGGGTLDLALVERRDGEFHLNHDWIGGDKFLGGEDIDDAMVEGVDSLCSKNQGRIEEQEDERQTHIRRNLKEGKELLSRKTQHKFRLPYEQPHEFVWSRGEFEEFTAAITDRAIDCLRKQLEKIRARGIQPDQILLVGGSSNIPVVKRRIEAELGLKALLWENSQTAVALGAATAHVIGQYAMPSATKPPKVSDDFRREVVKPKTGVAHSERPEEAPGHSSFSSGRLRAQLEWGEYGILVRDQSGVQDANLESLIRESHLGLGPSIIIHNVGDSPACRITVEVKLPENGKSFALPDPIPILETGEKMEINPVLFDEFDLLFFPEKTEITIKWFGGPEKGFSLTVDLDLLPPQMNLLPIAAVVKHASFSGKILQIINLSSDKVEDLTIEKNSGGKYVIRNPALGPGQSVNVGWCQFSDQSNLKSGDFVTLSRPHYQKTGIIIA